MIKKNNRFKVSGDGVFFSIQGEGFSIGKPSCFLRLQLCNLRCNWCDTQYTWDPSKSRTWTIKKTKQKIEDAWRCSNSAIKKRLIITGGEPLLQQKAIQELIGLMPGWHFEIETNGTIMPSSKLLEICQFNCSPKLRNSGIPKKKRIIKKVIKALCKANSNLKFVVTASKDIKEIEKDFLTPFNIDPNKVIIMPQGTTVKEIQKNAKKVVKIVKQKGYRLLGRLHIEIWGLKRKI